MTMKRDTRREPRFTPTETVAGNKHWTEPAVHGSQPVHPVHQSTARPQD